MLKVTLFLLIITCNLQPNIQQYNPQQYPSYNKTELFTETEQNLPFRESYGGDIQTALSGSVALINESERMQIRADEFYQYSQTEYTVVSTYITYLEGQD